jgi:hypothetical protein
MLAPVSCPSVTPSCRARAFCKVQDEARKAYRPIEQPTQ